MTDILRLNEISPVVDDVFKNKYRLVKESANPAGIMLRSFNMHEYNMPESVICVGRAGAGVNNIPVDKYAEKGVVVFNTPGANANAVKELVICSLLMCGRKIADGINWTNTLKSDVAKTVESGKKEFIGGEILGKTLGVVGLGAIGALVANAAIELGMKVIGYDPFISVDGAWTLDHHVKKETDLNSLFSESDFITMHVPLNDSTKKIVNAETLALMKDGVSIVNCSRGELVDNEAIKAAIKGGKVNRYVTDFPTEDVLNVDGIIAIPHLGASTPEAEDNCAYMAAKQMADFIENGNICNSVNFPACSLNRSGEFRYTVIHRNVKNVLVGLTDIISKAGINISNFVSQSKGAFAYTIIDLDEKLGDNELDKIKASNDVIRVRII